MTNLTAQEFGFISTNGNPTLENIINNEVIKAKIVVGKTYTAAMNNYGISTSTNDSVTFKFASDTIVRLSENSSFNIDSYEQSTIHATYPQQTIYTDFSCNTSLLHGDAEIINNSTVNETNNFYINTRLACIICGKGKFIIKSADNSSTFIILEGNATIMDNLGRKLYKVKQNDIITITPRPALSGKAGELMRKQNIVTSTQLDSNDCTVLNNDFVAYDNEQHHYIFVTTDSSNKIVKLKN